MKTLNQYIVIVCLIALGCGRVSSGEKMTQSAQPQATIVSSSFAPSIRPAPVAIGKGRIGQLDQGKFRVWRMGNWKAPELELGEGLIRLTALRDGSLAVLGKESACLLRPEAKALTCDKVSGLLWRESQVYIWGAPAGSLGVAEGRFVSHLRLSGKEAVLDRSIALEKAVLQTSPLEESTIVWTDGNSVMTTSRAGEHTTWYPESGGGPMHVAPVRDGIWVSQWSKRVILLQDKKVIRTIPSQEPIISMTADDRHVALLTVADSRTQLHASLFDPSGKQLWSAEFAVPSMPPAGQDPHIVISPFEPIVVVGSKKSLQIFDRASGEPIGEAGDL